MDNSQPPSIVGILTSHLHSPYHIISSFPTKDDNIVHHIWYIKLGIDRIGLDRIVTA